MDVRQALINIGVDVWAIPDDQWELLAKAYAVGHSDGWHAGVQEDDEQAFYEY